MEWLAVVLLPMILGIWTIYRGYKQDAKEMEDRLDSLESRVTILEQTVGTINDNLAEIKELRNEIKAMHIMLSQISTLLEERTKKGG